MLEHDDWKKALRTTHPNEDTHGTEVPETPLRLLIKVKLTTCFHEFSEYESTNFFYQILNNILYDLLKNENKMLFF